MSDLHAHAFFVLLQLGCEIFLNFCGIVIVPILIEQIFVFEIGIIT